MNPPKIVITGGGTGGHVFPALAIAEEMKKRGWDVLYVGTTSGMESKLVPEAGFAFFTVKTGAVKNQSALKIFSTLFQLLRGILWSLSFLRRQKPAAVLGVGGYVSVPICIAGFLLRLPLYLQEQNSSVGIANRFLGKLANNIFLGFSQAIDFFNPEKCIVTGNPLRSTFYQTQFPAYRSEATFLLILGGSQGAKAINDAVVSSLERLHTAFPTLKIFHQTGQRDFQRVLERVGNKYQSFYECVPFVSSVSELYGKASLVVSRSGALTVSELIQVGRPAIFVPFPRIGQNDQLTNAYLVEKIGAAKVVEQGDGFSERLERAIVDTLGSSKLEEMANAYVPLRFPSPLQAIGDRIAAGAQR